MSIGTGKRAGTGTSSGVVVVHQHFNGGSHDAVSNIEIAKKIAGLKGYSFAGAYDRRIPYPGPVYHVPGATLVGAKAAADIGIRGEQDLFGGLVPFDFVATKAIVHPLVDTEAAAPTGWSDVFARRVQPIVLAGYTAFTRQDAYRAGALLLENGKMRIKPSRAVGGHDQTVISTLRELERAVAGIASAEIEQGVVLEENLVEVTTHSVGSVCVGDLVATYSGMQRLTSDNTGAPAYGGSSLLVVRGGFEKLLAFDMSPEARLAVAQARHFDLAATEDFPELIASRRNYDVAQGLDESGRWRSGVLEQSWRIGGASGAEIVALQAFQADPELPMVQAACFEIFGEREAPPEHAFVYFRGVDRTIGALTKYALIEAPHHAK